MQTRALFLSVMLASAGSIPAQEMTARDMFHSAAGLLVPAKAGAKAAAKAKTPSTPSRPSTGKVDQAKAAKPKSPPASSTPGPSTPGRAADPEAKVIPASLTPGVPLGLRYSILKQTSGGHAAEVDVDSVFRSGDRIRLRIESNDTAHLYIIQRGSSGNWSVLFPSAEIAGGANVIEPGRQYDIPAGHWFAFDEQPGKEKVFIVLSRRPEPNLEKMIYSLREGETPAAPPAAPAAPAGEKKAVLLAENRISDSVVERIRSGVLARDLVFEKVDEKTPGEKKEKAVYVVNRTGSEESRVIADVTLNHQ